MINPEVIKHINPLVAEMEKHIQEIKVGWEPIVLWSQKSPEEKQKIFDKYRTKNLPNWEAMKADFKRQKEEMKANQ
ncbi:hypothetical protein [Leptospira stimsonii]|nr:hypothetical protein [Leptospira stimsonii]